MRLKLTSNSTFGLVFLIFLIGCQRPTEKSDLESIDLLRGDITLCGDQNFGEINFAVSCNSKTQEEFNLGLSLLHSFEYEEAEKSFVKVIDEDPQCAMAYWGVAMSNFHSLWLQSGTDYLRKGNEILKAVKKIHKTEREEDYIDAISAFYDNWEGLDRQTRIKKFETKMKRVYEKYKDDKEAAIFYALTLLAAADPSDKTYQNQLKSGEILESIFPNQPNHPGIAHYIIHNYDYPELAERALSTARRYAQIAPSSAHAQHMPSHIFTQLGLWQESINSNLNSVASALCYSKSIDPEGHWDEELHGIDYLVYAYLQIGDTESVREQLNYLKAFKKVFPQNFKVAYTLAAVPTRIVLETKNWSGAANLEFPSAEIEWNNFPWQRAIIHFGRALGLLHLGDNAKAEVELKKLIDLRGSILKLNDQYKANQVDIQIITVKAWLALAVNDHDRAVALMKRAVEMENSTSKHPVTPGEVLPAGQLLGDLFMELDEPGEALEAYERDLKRHPNRFNGIYGAASAAVLLKNKEKAIYYFELLLKQALNSDRPEIIAARDYLHG